VVLVGPSGSGKTTFARIHFRPTEVVSSDACRAMVADDENALDANREAFGLLRYITTARLSRRRVAVVDATNLLAQTRRALVSLARSSSTPVVAIVFDAPLGLLEERAAGRQDRRIPLDVVGRHHAQLEHALKDLPGEDFDEVHVLRSPDEVDAFSVERATPLPAAASEDAASAAGSWIRAWEEGWPRKDVEAVASRYAESAVYRALAFREPRLGTHGAREYLRENFDVEDDVRCWFGDPIVQDDRAAVEWWAHWTENGRPVTLAGATVLRFTPADLVAEERDYWNQTGDLVDPYPGW